MTCPHNHTIVYKCYDTNFELENVDFLGLTGMEGFFALPERTTQPEKLNTESKPYVANSSYMINEL